MRSLRTWIRESRALAWGLGVTALVSVGAGFVPGFAGPGYEIALILGFVMPMALAVTVARTPPRPQESVLARVLGAILFAGVHGAVALVVTMLHGLRVGFCEIWGGLTVLLLGPIAGGVVGALWGAAVSEVTNALVWFRSRSRLRTFLAVLGPLGSILVGLGRFYSSPMIFGYDPFVGYFSGTLYDTVLSYDTLATYRVGTAATVLAVVSASGLLERRDGSLKLIRPTRWGLVVSVALFSLASLAVTANGPSLGHWHTRATIAEGLGGKLVGDRCDLVYARTLPRADIVLLHKECEAHVAELEAWWGERGPDKITAFVFSDADQKSSYMGAGGTNIAKPWRAEVYIQGTAFPHRVLGHELMHVIAASRGQGPFRVGAHWGGLLPNPGLIEGVAVAGSPKEEDLSAAEWSKAMRDRKTLPPLEALLGLRFLSASSSLAYTASGAFVAWVHDRYGSLAVREWYGGKTLEEATGVPFPTLESDWHASLDAIALDQAALVQAEAKFERPGFFARRCPRLVDACSERAEALGRAGDLPGALREIEEARRFEPKSPNLRTEEAMLVAKHTPDEAEAIFQALIDDEGLPTFARDEMRQELADHLLAKDRPALARPLYEEVASRIVDDAKLRTLAVKIHGTEDAALRPFIVELLVGRDGADPDRPIAFLELGSLRERFPDEGLLSYLAARWFVDKGRYADASALLTEATRGSITIARVRAEALRLSVLAACGAGDVDGLRKAIAAYGAEPGVSAARLAYVRKLAARCETMTNASGTFVYEGGP